MSSLIVYNEATGRVIRHRTHGASPPDYVGRTDVLLDADLSAVGGLPMSRWGVSGGAVVDLSELLSEAIPRLVAEVQAAGAVKTTSPIVYQGVPIGVDIGARVALNGAQVRGLSNLRWPAADLSGYLDLPNPPAVTAFHTAIADELASREQALADALLAIAASTTVADAQAIRDAYVAS